MATILRGEDNVDSSVIAETTGSLINLALMKYDVASGKLLSTGIIVDASDNLRSTGELKSETALKLRTSGTDIFTVRDDLTNIVFETPNVSTDRGYSFRTLGTIDAVQISNAGSLSSLSSIYAGYNGHTNSYVGAEGVSFTTYANSTSYTSISGRTTSAGSTFLLNCVTGGIRRASIVDNGTFASATNVYGSTSDIKLKENIIDTTPKLEKLMQVQVRNFNYIGAEEKQIGVIAQEIEAIFPGVVYETEDEVLTEVTKTREITLEDGIVTTEEYLTEEMQPNGEFTKNVKYSVIYMMMLKGMQELNDKVHAQKQEIDELRKMIIGMKGAM